jgi:hypothetical protein
LELGNLIVKSDIDNIDREKRLKNKETTIDDYYDKYSLELKETQLFLTNYKKWNGIK